MEIVVAHKLRQRLFGLALRARPPDGWALLFPRCRSVHTFGMRFAIDVVFLDAQGRVLAIESGVRPGRVVAEPARGGGG